MCKPSPLRPSLYQHDEAEPPVRMVLPRLRSTRPSAPAYNATAGSSVCVTSDVAVVFTVRLSWPGLHQHIGPHCLHELFIEYEQVTTWEARFSSNKLEANYHVLSATVCTRWLNGQAHKSPPLQVWLNFKQPVGRNHWPSC